MRHDRPRDASYEPPEREIKWFKLYSAWEAIEYEDETVNQMAAALACRWDPTARTWVEADGIFREIYDPTVTSSAAVGDLVRCVKMPNGLWEVFPATSPQVLQYRLSARYYAQGFNGSYQIDQSNQSGTFGARARAGSESSVGIAFDADATPATNGNFVVNRQGLYRVDFSLHLYIDWGGAASDYQTTINTGSTSGHTHTVTYNDPEKLLNFSGSNVTHLLSFTPYRKVGAAAIGVYEDELSNTPQWRLEPWMTINDGAITATGTWFLSLNEDDRLAFKIGLSSPVNNHTVSLETFANHYLTFTNCGGYQTWETLL